MKPRRASLLFALAVSLSVAAAAAPAGNGQAIQAGDLRRWLS